MQDRPRKHCPCGLCRRVRELEQENAIAVRVAEAARKWQRTAEETPSRRKAVLALFAALGAWEEQRNA